ncbi:hypothetical protein CL628_01165 [bacterium]|nr:hypothetical protein [bacterium]
MEPIDENKGGEKTPSQTPPTPPPLPPANLPVVPPPADPAGLDPAENPQDHQPDTSVALPSLDIPEDVPKQATAPDEPVSLDIPDQPPSPPLTPEPSEPPPMATEPAMDVPPAPPVPPAPAGLTVEPKKSGKKWIVIVVVLLVVVLIGGGAAAAYFMGLVRLPFLSQQLNSDQVFDRMYQAIAGIETTNYSLTLAVNTEPREAGARPLSEAIAAVDETTAALKRDQQRLDDVTALLAAIKLYKTEGGNDIYYPRDLLDVVAAADQARISAAIQAGEYGYRQDPGGTSFVFNVQLETEVAARKYAETQAGTVVPLATPHAHAPDTPADHPHEPVLGPAPTLLSFTQESDLPLVVYLDESDASPLPLDLGLGQIYQLIPLTFDLNFGMTGKTAATDTDTVSAEFSLNGSLKLDGATFSGSGDIKILDQDVYLKVNEFPSLGFFDAGAVKGQWIHIPADDLRYEGFDSDIDEFQQSTETSVDQYKEILKLAHELDMIRVVQEFPIEKIERDEFYHYEIDLAPEQLPVFYERVLELVAGDDVDTVFSEVNDTTLDYLRSDAFKDTYEVLRENTTMEIWINTKTFYPSRFTYRMRFVPPDTVVKFADKQITVEIGLGYQDINQPTTITAPAETISIDEATVLITGESPQEVSFDRVTDQIPLVRGALRGYWLHAGVYPGSLEDLASRPSEVVAKPAAGQLEAFDEVALQDYLDTDKPFLPIPPIDVVTGQPYPYTSTGQDYTLKYQVVFPTETSGIDFNEYDFARKIYVEGTNTATAASISVEGGQQAPASL